MAYERIPKKKKTVEDLMNEIKEINRELRAKYPPSSTGEEQKQGKGRGEGGKSQFDIWRGMMFRHLKIEYHYRKYSGVKVRPNLKWASNIWKHITSHEREPFKQLSEEDKIKATIQKRAGMDFDKNLGLRFAYLVERVAKELPLGKAAMESEKYKPATISLKRTGNLARKQAGGEDNPGSEDLKADGAAQKGDVPPKSTQLLTPRARSKVQMASLSSPSQLSPTMATSPSDLVSTNSRLQNHTAFVSHRLQPKVDAAPTMHGPVAASVKGKSTFPTTSYPEVPCVPAATPDDQSYIYPMLRPAKRPPHTLSDQQNEPPQKRYRSSPHSDHLTSTTAPVATNDYRAAISSPGFPDATSNKPSGYTVPNRPLSTHKFHADMSAQDNMAGASHAPGDNKNNKDDKNKNGKGDENSKSPTGSKNPRAPSSKSYRRILPKPASEQHHKQPQVFTREFFH